MTRRRVARMLRGMKVTIWLSVALAIGVSGCDLGAPPAPPPPRAASTKPAPTTLPTIKVYGEDKLYDVPLKTQITRRLVVSGALTADGLEWLLNSQHDELSAKRGFNSRDRLSHVFIYAYTSNDRAEAEGGIAVAWLTRIGDGAKPEFHLNKEILATYGQAPEVKFGLTEPQRQKVFRELWTAEQRGEAEAEKVHPIAQGKPISKERLHSHIDLKRSLTEKYKAEIRRKHKLTEDQQTRIGVEAMQKGWPAPPEN